MDWANLPRPLILIRGAGDLGSGVAFRLYKAGYRVAMTELPAPLMVRRTVSFGNAVFEPNHKMCVEDIDAYAMKTLEGVGVVMRSATIPILIEQDWRSLQPQVVIDARVAKRNIDTTINDARPVIALGPGFTAGVDCHAIIETNRGHRLGRVLWSGSAEPNTGTPGTVAGKSGERVLRAPTAGHVISNYEIGDMIPEGAVVATINDNPIHAPFAGMLRGIIHPSVEVPAGLKIGDLDPRGVREHCFEISDKALAIGGGVLEAILYCGILPERD